MRLCRFQQGGKIQVGFYEEAGVVPMAAAARARDPDCDVHWATSTDLLDFLPCGPQAGQVREIAAWLAGPGAAQRGKLQLAAAGVEMLVPVPRPNKLFLLAGNYAKHIEEGGGKAAERAETFPYVFMKPPSTTLTDPGKPVVIPQISPGAIDWELELAVIIGRRCKGVSEADALSYVAGYTVINDISNRRFKPNPQRKPRERDNFFDWLHGKWHDSFCPCGPCVATAETVIDPQALKMQLSVNGHIHQDASTSQMIFPVAAVIEFIASFVTLEPGDIISTGTPDGVGNAKGIFLKPGDQLLASIDRIGQLRSPVVSQ